jgi:hypothetical protein
MSSIKEKREKDEKIDFEYYDNDLGPMRGQISKKSYNRVSVIITIFAIITIIGIILILIGDQDSALRNWGIGIATISALGVLISPIFG